VGAQLATWPAELKPKAEALYRTGRAQRLIDFLAEHPGTWQARPNVHLAYHTAAPAQRLYPHCHLETTDYIHRWAADDFAQVRAHPHGSIREDLWPWLRQRQYAGPEDDQQLDAFLQRLGLAAVTPICAPASSYSAPGPGHGNRPRQARRNGQRSRQCHRRTARGTR
jgi:hypothetical protein